MKVVHLVICNDCGGTAYEIERSGNMHKYYCKRCNLIVYRKEVEDSWRKRQF